MILPLVLLLACGGDPNAPPPRPDGLLQVIEVETGTGVASGSAYVRARQPACGWGREVWWFEEGKITVQNDFVCAAASPDEAYACTVRMVADASWDAARGVFVVPRAVRGRARFSGVGDPVTSGERTRCSLEIAAGEYPVARVRNGQWKWEVSTPAGVVLRLGPGDARPDLTAAMRELGAP